MIKTKLLDPDILMIEDILADQTLGPQLRDPARIPAIKTYLRGEGPDTEPDLRTPRVDVYITGWNDRKDDTLPPLDESYGEEFRKR
ncbi:MAG: hypothetical protein WBA63_15105 [Thermomicrobiales bacterium]